MDELDYFEVQNHKIETIFFGGGTPSLMLVKFAEKVIKKLKFSPNFEWTLEANPKTISSLDLKDWKDLGLNRLSIGIQSFNDEELSFLGRIHTVKDSLNLLDEANELGLRISADFIYGLPNHNKKDVINLCKRINETELNHVSLYELTIETGTKFAKLPKVSEEIASDMYKAIQDNLNLSRYEVSNYSKSTNDVCLHNANIWKGDQYIGVGESAAGRIRKVQDSKFEWFETKITNGKIIQNSLTNRERAVEMIITGLRTKTGVQISNLPEKDIINWDFIKYNQNYFLYDEEFLSMSDVGLMLLDGLIKEVIL